MSQLGQKPKSWRLKVMSALARTADIVRRDGTHPHILPGRANHFVFSEMACPAPFAKIFPFRPDPNQMHIHCRLVPTRGAIARRHERGAGCGGRESVRHAMAIAGRDEPRERSASVQDDRRFSGRQSRVVLAPVAGVKFAEARRPDRAQTRP